MIRKEAGVAGWRRICSTHLTKDNAYSERTDKPARSRSDAITLFRRFAYRSGDSESTLGTLIILAKILLCHTSTVLPAAGDGVHMLYWKLQIPLESNPQKLRRDGHGIFLHVRTRAFRQNAASHERLTLHRSSDCSPVAVIHCPRDVNANTFFQSTPALWKLLSSYLRVLAQTTSCDVFCKRSPHKENKYEDPSKPLF